MNGLFETILVRDSIPVLLEPHLDRLLRSAATLGVPGAPDRGQLRDECLNAAAASGLALGRLRVSLADGAASVTVEGFEGYPAEIYETGVRVLVAAERGHPLGPRAGHKALPYDVMLDARRRAHDAGAFEVIFRDEDGALLEGSASNLFVVTRGEILTPPLTRPILPGVTRAAALEAARQAGLPVREIDVFPEDLQNADEAFLTGALMEVVPVAKLGERVLETVGEVSAAIEIRGSSA